MTHPLDGAFLKLARAEEHLVRIKARVSTVDKGPHVIAGTYDSDHHQFLFLSPNDGPSDTWLSLDLGEMLYNAACALDYIVNELVERNGETVTRRTGFPIFTCKTKYDAPSVKAKTAGIPDAAAAIFDALQPCNRPDAQPWHPGYRDPLDDPLAILYRLNNRDKHRALRTTYVIAQAQIKFPDNSGPFIDEPTPMPFRPTTIKRGTPLAFLNLGDMAWPPDMKVNLHLRMDIAVDDPEGDGIPKEIAQTLDQIPRAIRNRVLPRFAQFFPPRP